MKKKLSLLICTLTAILCFTGCASTKAELDYDKATVEQSVEFLVSYCSSADDAAMEQWGELSDYEIQYQLMQAGLPYTPDSFLGAMESWTAGVEECGAYVGHGDYVYEASEDELKVTTEAQFKNRDASLTFIFDDNLNLESMTVDAQYSTGEILKKAGLNTLLGMGTVFMVLIFISLIISLFKYIPAIENALKKKPKEAEKEVVEEPVVEEVSEEQDVTDDTELVAVIAAAIAAADGTTTDGFVVRSIRRRPANKWNS
ncbi:oxaloacetate decarboxylase gamma chain [Dorea sp. CAG:317]|nr:oxaloacetate decarboxylase gamma chain [Dorea sp. CAG:317]